MNVRLQESDKNFKLTLVPTDEADASILTRMGMLTKEVDAFVDRDCLVTGYIEIEKVVDRSVIKKHKVVK